MNEGKGGGMKRLPLIVTAVLVLGLGVIGCAETSQPQYLPYTPKYTADQVIAVAQAQYPVGYKYSIGTPSTPSERIETPTMISVRYLGGSRAAWQVDISLPPGYHYSDGSYGTKRLYFYETDGSLRDTYNP